MSIVVPVYYNAENLPATIPELLGLRTIISDVDLELLFVDDGSRDDSFLILRKFQSDYPGVIRIVRLTRNFGSFAAMQAGLNAARGDCIGIISADLQDPPELFAEMFRHWQAGIKTVYAVRQSRQDRFASKLLAQTFYWFIRRLSVPDYPPGGFDFCLMDRQVCNAVTSMEEKNTHLMTLIFWLGFPYVTLPYHRAPRAMGKSRWTLSKRIKLAIDSFVSFSYTPIRLLSVTGLCFASLSFLYGSIIAYLRFANNIPIAGWSATMVFVTFTAGIQMTMIGVLGEYLWRALDAARRRPQYVIDEIFETASQSLPGGAVSQKKRRPE